MKRILLLLFLLVNISSYSIEIESLYKELKQIGYVKGTLDDFVKGLNEDKYSEIHER